jgi:predicted nucleotidyltransferase
MSFRRRWTNSSPGSLRSANVTASPFFELQKELEDILGCEVDLLTRRSVEQDQNSIRRRSILQSTREIYTA